MAYTEDGKQKLEIKYKLVSAIIRWCIVTGLINENPPEPKRGTYGRDLIIFLSSLQNHRDSDHMPPLS